MWTVSQLAHYCDVHRSTIQRRTKDYAWALSDNADRAKGEDRQYSPRDVAIMREIDRLLKAGLDKESTSEQLKQAIERGEFDDINAFPLEPDSSDAVPFEEHRALMSRAETAVDIARQEARAAIAEANRLREEKARLEGELSEVRKQLDEQKESRERITELEKRIVELETEKRLLEKQPKRGWFGR